MTELPCPACHGEMMTDWGGGVAECSCSAVVHMGGGWLWPSFAVVLRAQAIEKAEPPPERWDFDPTLVRATDAGLLDRWFGHTAEVLFDRSALRVRWKAGRLSLRRTVPPETRLPTPGIQRFVGLSYDGFVEQAASYGRTAMGDAPPVADQRRIRRDRGAVFAVTREPALPMSDDVPTWLRGRVLHLGMERCPAAARSAAAHLNAAQTRFAGGYR